MKKVNFKKININKETFRRLLKHALSPVFLVLLLSSFVLWFTTQLGIVYDTEIPINIRIDGQKYRITADVRAKGSTLMAQRLSLKSKISLKSSELTAKPSPDDPAWLIVDEGALRALVNSKTSDLEIKKITTLPAIPADVPEEEGPQQ